MYNWSQISEYVLQLPYQQYILVLKENVAHPEVIGTPYRFGAYRFNVPDGRTIDIKVDGDYWSVHWDKHNPSTHLIEHALDDAPLEWVLTTTASGAVMGAFTSEEGKKDEGALKGASVGFGLGLSTLLLRAIAVKN